MTITRETRRRVMLGTSAAAFVVLLTAALMPTSPANAVTPQQALAAALAGQYNCTMTDQVDGFTLVCRVPSSPSPSASASATSSPSPSPTVSPSPSPTSSPTVTGGNNCIDDPGRCGFPNAANTGPSGNLTVQTGNLTITTANTVVENRDIRGCVQIRANNVTLRNVKVSGSGCWPGVVSIASTSIVGARFEDSELSCNDTPGSHGITPWNIIVTRADIHSCENGFSIGPNVLVQDSWIHDLYDGGDAHADGAQFGSDAAFTSFVHNTIDVRGNTTSAIIMWDENTSQQNHDILIDRNLMAGGAYTVYCGRYGTAVNVRITNNRFGAATYGSSAYCGDNGEIWSGNVIDATGAPRGPN